MGGHSKVWWHLGRLTRAFFLLIAALLFGWTLYSGMWNSSLAATTPTTSLELIDTPTGQQLRYSYTVDGEKYQAAESPGPRSNSGWESGDASEPIRYLTFSPRTAHLEFLVERFDWTVAVFGQFFILSLAYAGHAMMKSQRKLETLAENCTHLLPGQVVQVIQGQGQRIVIYEAISPDNGETVRGSVQVGAAEPVKNALTPGAQVAVLYLNRSNHTLL